jgi:hypothetical protein
VVHAGEDEEPASKALAPTKRPAVATGTGTGAWRAVDLGLHLSVYTGNECSAVSRDTSSAYGTGLSIFDVLLVDS